MTRPSQGCTTQGWRWFCWLSSLTLWLILALLWSQQESIFADSQQRVLLAALGWLAMLGLVLCLPKLPAKQTLWLLLGSALLLRLCLWNAPVSDDVQRYLWEGKLVAEGQNPYAAPAADPRWQPYHDQHFAQLNHPERPTAYPPGMLLTLGLTSKISYQAQAYKALALLGELAVVLLLLALARHRHRQTPLRWLGFWLFNPLILAAFAIEAHFDSLMVAALLGTLLAHEGKRPQLAWALLGLAIQFKLMALVIAPLLLLANTPSLRQIPKASWQTWPLWLALLLPSLPFWAELSQLFAGLCGFGSAGAFNAPLYEVARFLGLDDAATRLLLLVLFTLSFAALCLPQVLLLLRTQTGGHRAEATGGNRAEATEESRAEALGRGGFLLETAFFAFQFLLLFSPVVHFWYLSWTLWFLILRPQLSWILLSGSMSLYFLAWQTQEQHGWWGYPRELSLLIWTPFLLALLWENRHVLSRWKQSLQPQPQPQHANSASTPASPPSLSLLVPLLHRNQAQLQKTKQFLQTLAEASPQASELLLIDASQPEFQLQASQLPQSHIPCQILPSDKGRGQQIAHGCQQAQGKLIAIIHADTQPQANWLEALQAHAQANPKAPAFALGQRFDQAKPQLLLIETLNEARASLGSSIFGDQTLIIRREALEKIGGFPSQPLMEDVEVSHRLQQLGQISYLGQEWPVSAQKWQNRFSLRFGQIIQLLLSYQLTRLFQGQEKAAQLSQKLYQEYYRK